MNNSGNRRYEGIDFCKGILILLVLLQHVYNLYGFTGNKASEIIAWKWIQIVNMPSFFIISGYFFYHSLSAPFRKFLVKKVNRLILPWLICGIIVFLSQVALKDLSLSFESLWYSLKEVWFLPQLFIIMLITYGINKTRVPILKIILWAVVAICAYYGLIGLGLVNIVSFTTGMLIKFLGIEKRINYKSFTVFFLFVVVQLLGYFGYYSMNYIIVHTIISIVLSLDLIMFLLWLHYHSSHNKSILALGRRSLEVYLVQKVIVEIWAFRIYHKVCVSYIGYNPLVIKQWVFEIVWAIPLAIVFCIICMQMCQLWDFYRLKKSAK